MPAPSAQLKAMPLDGLAEAAERGRPALAPPPEGARSMVVRMPGGVPYIDAHRRPHGFGHVCVHAGVRVV